MNIFEKVYNTRKEYIEALTDESKVAARKKVDEAEDQIENMGIIGWKIYKAYEKARDLDNEVLDFHSIIWERDVEPLVACMKKNGIKAFTYSCPAPDAVETLWLFQQAGCTIGDLIEVNFNESLTGKGYEKGHAFKISIN